MIHEVRKHEVYGMELDVLSQMEFDMIGVDAAIANAIRRILIAEVGNFFCDHFECSS